MHIQLVVDRIVDLMNSLDLSAKDFAISIGRKPGIITDWKTGRSFPSVSDIVTICITYHYSINKLLPELIFESSESTINNKNSFSIVKKYMQLTPIDQEKVNHFIEIALFNAKPLEVPNTPHNILKEESTYNIVEKTIPILGIVAAGTPILSYESALDSVQSENKDASYALIAKGNSMNPIILDGEIVEVINQQELENGEIGIIKVDDEATCKRYYKFEDRIELRSINQDYDPIIIFKTSSKNLQIVGKVILTRVQQSRF